MKVASQWTTSLGDILEQPHLVESTDDLSSPDCTNPVSVDIVRCKYCSVGGCPAVRHVFARLDIHSPVPDIVAGRGALLLVSLLQSFAHVLLRHVVGGGCVHFARRLISGT